MDIIVNGFEEGYIAGIKHAMAVSRPKGPKPANSFDAIGWNAQSSIYNELRRELENIQDD